MFPYFFDLSISCWRQDPSQELADRGPRHRVDELDLPRQLVDSDLPLQCSTSSFFNSSVGLTPGFSATNALVFCR